MKMVKKVLTTLMALVMVAGLMPVTVSAANEVSYAVEGGNIYFDPETGAITGCDESVTAAEIPPKIDGVTVTSIGNYAFRRTSLASISIPASVTSISPTAFDSCYRLETIIVDANNSHYCVVDNVLFDKMVTKIIRYPHGRDAEEYTIPAGVISIGERAFEDCGQLCAIEIPESVEHIELGAFMDCYSLKSLRLPSNLVTIGANTFLSCGALTAIEIPDSVTSLGGAAFHSCGSLEKVWLPAGIEIIDESTFYDCYSLASVTIPDGVTDIGKYAFYGCDNLTSVTMPSSITSIGFVAFKGCSSLSDVYFGGSKWKWNDISVGEDNDPLLNATVHYATPSTEAPEPTDKPAIVSELAIANKQSVLVDGSPIEFEVYALEDENGGETNYIKLRDLAFILNGTAAQFEVSWDGAVNIVTGQPYTQNGTEMDTPFEGDRAYRPTDAVTKVNGVVTEFDAICLEDDNGGEYNYYKLRDLGKALGFDVSWSYDLGIYIETDEPYTDD